MTTVQQMKASIDRSELARIQRRFHRRSTKKIIGSAAKWTGGFLLVAGSLFGIGAAAAATRKDRR